MVFNESAKPAAVAVRPPRPELLVRPGIGYGAAMRNLTCDGSSPDRRQMHRLLRSAVALGAPLIDTAGSYGGGTSEAVIAEALAPYPADLMIATKGGVRISTQGKKIVDARPDQLKADCESSRRRLRVETIDLFQLHWPDPAVPLAEQIGAMAELRRAGKIRHVGLCNVSLADLVASEAIVPIASVQLPFGLLQKNDLDILAYASIRGINLIGYGPLAVLRSPPCEMTQRATDQAHARGCTLAQFALEWALRQGPNVIPIPATLSVDHLEENMRVAALRGPHLP